MGVGKVDWNSCKTQELTATVIFFEHLFSGVQEPFRTGSRFPSILGRTEQCHSTDRTLGHQKEYRQESVTRNDAQSRALDLSAVIQTSWSFAAGKTNHFAPCKTHTVSSLKALPPGHSYYTHICTTGLLCIPWSITSSLPSHHLLVLSNLALPEGKNSRWLFSV